jgi:hypothetical protein
MNTAETIPTPPVKDKIIIYFLASSNPQDIDACDKIHDHLSQFIRNAKPAIEIYSDSMIEAGEDKEKYMETLFAADLVIVFGSSDFIADDINFERIKKVIARYNNRETRLMALIVRNFLWNEPFFNKLPVILPKTRMPLYDIKTWGIDEAFATVAQEMIDVITKHYKIEQSSIEIKPW